jgi:hypothetical protein
MENIVFVTAQPDVPYFHWQVELYIHNFTQLGINPEKIHILFSTIGENKPSSDGLNLKKYGVNVNFYKDERNRKNYIPSIKPFLIYKWLEQYPKYGKCFFLHDADIIFRKLPDFEKLLGDDISYISDTISYIGYNYIIDCCKRYENQHPNSEKNQLISEMANIVGLDVEIIKENQLNSGGGQYLIKNTNYKLWEKIYMDCAPLYNQMLNYHRRFPINQGQIQFWTAEMWSLLWNLWKFNYKTKITEEFGFSWATDPIVVYNQKPILHMAGVTDDLKSTKFYKGDFINVNPIEKLKESPNYFDYIDKGSSTIKYIEVMKSFIEKTNN